MEKCQDRSFRFANFIRSQTLTRIIGHVSLDSEFAHDAFFSSSFSFRFPSETLCFVRAYSDDALDTCPPSLRGPSCGQLYRWRVASPFETVAGGRHDRRMHPPPPLIFHLSTPGERSLLPAHAIRPRVCR